jgi:hypothetical protein
MSSNESRVSPIWYVIGIVIVGIVAWWVIKFVLSILGFVILGAVIVGAIMLYSKSKRALRGGNRRELDR